MENETGISETDEVTARSNESDASTGKDQPAAAPSADKDKPAHDADEQQASSQKDSVTQKNEAASIHIDNQIGKFEQKTIILGGKEFHWQVAGQVKEEALFSQVMTSLPPRPEPNFILESIDTYFDQLLEDRLILISCQFDKIANDASYALIDRLGITDADRKKKLDLQSAQNRDKLIWTWSFLPEDKQPDARTAIVVNALHRSAQNTLDEMIADTGRSEDFKHQLKEKGVYVLCIVESAYIDERQCDPRRAVSFPHWQIPFLRPLLKQHNHEGLIEKILRQRDEGKWSKDDTEFCSRIYSCLLRKELPAEIKRLDDPKPPPAPGEIFKADDPILKPILFMATYFRDLTAQEFSDSVECLLGDREIFVSIPEYRRNGEGELYLTNSRAKLPIMEIWRDNKDSIMWKQLCETYSARCSNNVIDFRDHTLRQSLKDYLAEQYSLLVKDQFRHLQNQGFLFYKSDRVAENMIRLMMEMISAYPNDFNEDSIIEMITTANRRLKFEDSPNQDGCNFLKKTRLNSSAQFYSRICELMQQMLKAPRMKELVDDCLAELMKRKEDHLSALEIVRRLRFESEIEKFRWVKRLLHQGDMDVRRRTYTYLYNEVKKSNAALFDRHELLEKWLPDEDRYIGRYPISGSYALRSLLEYCLNTIESFDQERYGQWPSAYRLFTFADSEEAERILGRLMKWLFHPAMMQAWQQIEMDITKETTQKSPLSLVAALISEWFFILVGPKREASDQKIHDDAAAMLDEVKQEDKAIIEAKSELDAARVTTILLRQAHQAASRHQRKKLLEYWKQLKDFLIDGIRDIQLSRQEDSAVCNLFIMSSSSTYRFSREENSASWRASLAWRRDRLGDLIKAFGSI